MRVPVTKQRAMELALALADAGGIESLSMRRLAKELGVGQGEGELHGPLLGDGNAHVDNLTLFGYVLRHT